MRKMWVVGATLLVLLLGGCGLLPDGGPDGDDDSLLGGPGCPTPLAGAEPFGAVLAGVVTYEVEGQGTVDGSMSIEAYFPEGRGPGAPVLLVGPASYWGGIKVTRFVLDDEAGADVGWYGTTAYRPATVEGRLVGPDGGLRGTAHRNFAEPTSDVPVPGEGPVTLCPAGAPPAPELAGPAELGPTSAASLLANVPIEPGTLQVTVTADGAEVPVRAGLWPQDTDYGRSVSLAPETAYPPNRELLVTVEATDVLGRPFTLKEALGTRRTTAVVSDLDFTEQPPDGAVAADASHHVRDGALLLGDGAGFEALIALPDPGDAERLRAELGWESGCFGIGMSVVDADGSVETAAAELQLGEAGTGSVSAPLPPGRPLWLVLDVHADRPEPQSLPPPPCDVALDALVFE